MSQKKRESLQLMYPFIPDEHLPFYPPKVEVFAAATKVALSEGVTMIKAGKKRKQADPEAIIQNVASVVRGAGLDASELSEAALHAINSATGLIPAKKKRVVQQSSLVTFVRPRSPIHENAPPQ